MGPVPCEAALDCDCKKMQFISECNFCRNGQSHQFWLIQKHLERQNCQIATFKPFETISQLSSNQISCCQLFSNQLIQTCIFLIIGVPLNSPYGEMYCFGNCDSITHYIVTICMMMHFIKEYIIKQNTNFKSFGICPNKCIQV